MDKDIKNIVKNKYKTIASTNCGCGCGCKSKNTSDISKEIGYSDEELVIVGEANLGLGCGNPVALSKIKPGDTVVDLGSGAGIDCFLAAKKVGDAGKVIGIDMTEEMINRAKATAVKNNYKNVEFRLGDIENLPVDSESVDIIISNCVINLAPDKDKVFSEAYRILKTNGAMYVSDIVLLEELTAEQKNNEELIAGCVGGALLVNDYIEKIKKAGFKINILSENKDLSKQQYQGIPLKSLLVEAIKTK